MIWILIGGMWFALLCYVLFRWQKSQNQRYATITARVQIQLTGEQKALTRERAEKFHGERVPEDSRELDYSNAPEGWDR